MMLCPLKNKKQNKTDYSKSITIAPPIDLHISIIKD